MADQRAAIFFVLVGACSRAPSSVSDHAAPDAASVSVALVPPAPSKPPAKRLVSLAAFDGTNLIMCIDADVTGFSDEKVAEFGKGDTDAGAETTRLAQPCESLGRTALTTCTVHGGRFVTRYYDSRHSDKYMASCVKGGGRWETNKSDEADLVRAQQDLEKLKAGQ